MEPGPAFYVDLRSMIRILRGIAERENLPDLHNLMRFADGDSDMGNQNILEKRVTIQKVIGSAAQLCRGLNLRFHGQQMQKKMSWEPMKMTTSLSFRWLLIQIDNSLQKLSSTRSLDSVLCRTRRTEGLRSFLQKSAATNRKCIVEAEERASVLLSTTLSSLEPPPRMLGRKYHLAFALDLLWKNSSPHIAILGPPGIGKTTLAKSILEHPQTASRFTECFFVSFCGLVTISEMLDALSDELHIRERKGNLQIQVLDALRGDPKILCIDQFNDPWQVIQLESEQLLEQLSGIPTLAVLVTMRGETCLDGIWTLPELPPLRSLSVSKASAIFKDISDHKPDEYVAKLVKAVNCVPAAVVMLARHARIYGTEKVWKEWEIQFDSSAARRSSFLSNPKNLPATDILSLIAYLPDGLHVSFIPRFQSFLPSSINLKHCLEILVHESLISKLEDEGRKPRYVICNSIQLPSVPANNKFTKAVVNAYVQLMNEAGDAVQDREKQDMTLHELQNVGQVLLLAFSDPKEDTETRIKAAMHYIMQWFPVHCDGPFFHELSQHIIRLAMMCATSPFSKASCHVVKGVLFYWIYRPLDAQAELLKALELYQQLGDLLWVGITRRRLAMVLEDMDQLNDAENEALRALELHREAQSTLNEARALVVLGTIKRRLHRMEDAERYFRDAIALNTSCNDWAQVELGILYHEHMGRSKDGEAAFMESLHQVQESGLLLMEMEVRNHLGDLYLQMDRLEESETQLLRSISIGKMPTLSDSQCIGWTLSSLGEVCKKAGRWMESAENFRKAAAIYRQAGKSEIEGTNQQFLGEVCEQLGQLEEAKVAYCRWVELSQHLGDFIDESWARAALSRVYFALHSPHEAEMELLASFQATKKSNDVNQQVNIIDQLGSFYRQTNRHAEAAASFIAAADLRNTASTHIGEQVDFLHQAAQLYMQLGLLDKAEPLYHRALGLSTTNTGPWDECWTRLSLGDVFLQSNRLKEAETQLKMSLVISRKHGHKYPDALASGFLGRVYAQWSRWDDSLANMLWSVRLKCELGLLHNEATDQVTLGSIYRKHLGRIFEAEVAYNRALSLFLQTGEIAAAGSVAIDIGELYILDMGLIEKGIDILLSFCTKVSGSPSVLVVTRGLGSLAGYLQGRDRFEEAEHIFLQAISMTMQHSETEASEGWLREQLANLYFQWPHKSPDSTHVDGARLVDAEHQLNLADEIHRHYGMEAGQARIRELRHRIDARRRLRESFETLRAMIHEVTKKHPSLWRRSAHSLRFSVKRVVKKISSVTYFTYKSTV
ncbi:hypothetical protein C8J56DRAFT_983590 [Mycena floridula]|nr:hypothetical protein C8J56DRAFT_983590 [Mycena floridula]